VDSCKEKIVAIFTSQVHAIVRLNTVVWAGSGTHSLTLGCIIINEQYPFNDKFGSSVAYGLTKFGKFQETRNVSKIAEKVFVDASKFEVCHLALNTDLHNNENSKYVDTKKIGVIYVQRKVVEEDINVARYQAPRVIKTN
jgi:hypothetical protein